MRDRNIAILHDTLDTCEREFYETESGRVDLKLDLEHMVIAEVYEPRALEGLRNCKDFDRPNLEGRRTMNNKRLPYTRKNYWISVAASFLIASAANPIIGMAVGSQIARYMYLILVAYWIVIEIRRFHDANKSGWLALINILPGIGTFTALIIAGVLKSNYDNNRWLNSNISPKENDSM